jgi:hypothetical protein
MHRRVHVYVLSRIIDIIASLVDKIVRKYDTRHGTSAGHHIFLLRLWSPSGLRNEVLRNPVHIEVKVLIGIHM